MMEVFGNSIQLEHCMRYLLWLPLLLVAATINAADPAKEVESAIKVLNQAFENRDLAVVRSLMAPSHIAITPFAGRQSLDEQLQTLPELSYEKYSAGPMSATVLSDNCVVLNYALQVQGTFQGKPLPSDCLVSAIWVKNEGKWQELQYQETAVARDSETDEKLLEELTSLEKDCWEATLKDDKEFFKTFLADEAKGMLADGAVIGTEQIIKNLDNLDLKKYSMEKTTLLRIGRDAAMILYQASYEAIHKGVEEQYSAVNCSSLYVRRQGKWRQVFYQETPTAKK